MTDVDDLLSYLTDDERAQVQGLLAATRKPWTPLPGPQTQGYLSEATIVGFGGAAGGGKSALAVGLALTQHQRVAIFRQNGTELVGIVDYIAQVLGNRDGYNGAERIWRTKRHDGKDVQIEFGSFPAPGDETKYQGRPHDLIVFDEASNMRESAVRFLMGWLRTVDPDQPCRVLLTFNPPTSSEGRWVTKFFAPWLDRKHPKPAKPGELRWFAVMDGADVEVDGPAVIQRGEEVIVPQSRTFIPSRISDNPYLLKTGYMAQLQSLPEPLRSQMLYGDFDAGVEDDPYQVIPTAWVEAAMKRWSRPVKLEAMDSIGVDVAMGGRDNTIVARRHGMWFDVPLVYPGSKTPDGPSTAGLVIGAMRDQAVIHVDVFGVGAQAYGHLMATHQQVIGVNVGDPAGGVDKSGRIRFRNLRSELWWRMREALDPAANNGTQLPPDQQLLADLCAPTWEMQGNVLKVASRDEIVARIGRSPDWGSAYVLALMPTPKRAALEAASRPRSADYSPLGLARQQSEGHALRRR